MEVVKKQRAPKRKKYKYPNKIKLVMELLIEQGYFNREWDIINIALLEYFSEKGFFDVVRKLDKEK